jgi:hypothetical protein
MTGSGTRLGLRCQYCAGFAGCCLSAGGAVALARVLDEDELIEHWTHRSMRNRSRLQAPGHVGVAGFEPAISLSRRRGGLVLLSVAGRRVLPFGPAVVRLFRRV